MTLGKTQWIARFCAGILERDPTLDADDIQELAATLWDRPSCQAIRPEMAMSLLFAGQLGPHRLIEPSHP